MKTKNTIGNSDIQVFICMYVLYMIYTYIFILEQNNFLICFIYIFLTDEKVNVLYFLSKSSVFKYWLKMFKKWFPLNLLNFLALWGSENDYENYILRTNFNSKKIAFLT